MKKISFIIFLFTSILSAQNKIYNFNEIVISGSRIPIQFENLSRNVSIITSKQIEFLPASNFSDLLKYINGVEVRTRGIEGMQSDISIRGGTFEQTLILIDGVKMIDPQTGHHNLNIPINLDNIERIEILRGNGTKVFGANAFSGAINFITKKNFKNGFSLNTLAGENGLFDISFALNSSLNNSFYISRKKSDGYRFNTNFQNDLFSFTQNIVTNKTFINFFVGYVDKKFGANSFYSDRFPNQFERTLTRIANLKTDFQFENSNLVTKIFYRNNFDDYHLDFTRPDWNHNTHFSELYGFDVQFNFNSSLGNTSFGFDYVEDKISSSNLGKHKRNQFGFFSEHNVINKNNFSVSFGLYLYQYPNIKLKFWPGLDISYYVNDNLKLFTSLGKSFRVPTYTELYYVSPANLGNPNLQFEQSNNYEIGLDYFTDFYRINGSIFLKDGNNLIDWVRLNKNNPWKVENVTNLKTLGFEISVNLNPKFINEIIPTKNFKVDYTYLSSNRNSGIYESKYLLEYFKHQLILTFNNNFVFNSEFDFIIRFENRENYASRILVDAQILKSFNSFTFLIRATNLFNKTYFDFPGVILPGRWISAGLKYSFEFKDEK
ncbi:MAG: TonB-dependent receptor [Melioribacteraceae bacterium]|nr:TonB-dependent receptor [Melioribacteraceae bacterium]